MTISSCLFNLQLSKALIVSIVSVGLFPLDLACEVLDECVIEKAYADNQQNELYSIGYDYQFINDF